MKSYINNRLGLVAVTALLVGLSGCRDTESPQQQAQVVDETLCQFKQGRCAADDVTLTLSPAHAPSEQPLQLAVALPEGYKINSARIEGRDMFMGVVPVSFDAAGSAEAIYGSCSSDYMVWRLTVKASNEEGEVIERHFDWLADNQ